MDDTLKEVTVEFGGQSFTFKIDLTVGEEMLLAGRRSVLTGGEYGNLAKSKDIGEQMAAITADRIAEMEIRLIKAPDDFESFVTMKGKDLNKIWKEFADKSGLFPDNDRKKKEGKGEDSKENSEK